MNHDAAIGRIAAELALGSVRRTPADDARNNRWSQDYGKGRSIPAVDASRLAYGSSGLGDGGRGGDGKSRLDGNHHWISKATRETLMTFCPGTRVFLACVAVVAFIVVV